MKTIFINPFLMFGFTFLFVMVTFNFKLSGLYISASSDVMNIVFLLLISLSLFIGCLYKTTTINRNKLIVASKSVSLNKSLASGILIFGFLAECLNNNGIPLLMVFRGESYDYTQFGIKTFHVFYMGYLSASAVVNYERYIHSKKRSFLIPPILSIIITLLIMNRGATFLIIFPMALMYISTLKVKFRIRHMFIVLSGIVMFIVLFGVLGDKRMQASGYDQENAIYEIGKADPIFTGLPSGFFWTYLYSTSPFANLLLQENYNNTDRGDVGDFISAAILPDFISKYTNPDLPNKYALDKITPELNVATGFSQALIIYGVTGVILLFMWFLFVNAFFIKLNQHAYLISTCATLSSMAIFMSFNNMMIFSSCVIQLIFVTLLTRFKINKAFVL